MKTHTFNGVKYNICFVEPIEGLTDDRTSDEPVNMLVLKGNSIKALHSQLHEALHGIGVPDTFIHNKNGDYTTYDVARFLWRNGWRCVKPPD
jgi:hypothetical protein